MIEELGGKEIEFFSVRVELGKGGVEKILPIGEITKYEKSLIEAGVGELEGSIAKVSFGFQTFRRSGGLDEMELEGVKDANADADARLFVCPCDHIRDPTSSRTPPSSRLWSRPLLSSTVAFSFWAFSFLSRLSLPL